jgi:ribosomal protein L6P/L9E
MLCWLIKIFVKENLCHVLEKKLEIPKDVSITINKDKITVKGKRNLRTYHCRYIMN